MAQYVYRRPPYPYYDMEGIESWLEDLLTDGLWLDKDGYVFGMMQFRPGTPKKLKYRLEPIEKQTFLYLGQPDPPSEKALTLYEEFGWEYLGTFYDFYIYRSLDENAVELNTDPTLQAQALRHVRRRSGILLGFMIAIVAGYMWLLLRDGQILLQIMNRGWPRTGLLLLFMIIAILYSLVPLLHTIRLQKKLERGESLTRGKDWRKGRLLRHFLISLPCIMYLFLTFLNANSVNSVYDNAIDPETYHDPLPFVALADIAENRSLEPEGEPQLSVWSSPIAPGNIYWAENGFLNHPSEDRWKGNLEIFYHEAASEWIAKELIREYVSQHDEFLSVNAPGNHMVPEDFSAADYGFDELAVYGSHWGAVIFIRDGNRVVKATCTLHNWGTSNQLYALWLEKMADLYA